MRRPSKVWLPEGSWPTVLSFLEERFPGVSSQTWGDRLQRGEVQEVDGPAIALDQPYLPHRHLVYFREVTNEPVVPFAEHIIFEDDWLVVADKPHFLPVTPGGSFVTQTLQHRLQTRYNNTDLQVIHRIDRETAGLVVLVKQPRHRAIYQQLFADRAVTKQYKAIAKAPPEHFTFPFQHLSRLADSGRFFLQTEVPGKANSETTVDLLDRLPDGSALYLLGPITGKKHQLRVHMASLGLPIVGDAYYPDPLPQDLQDFSKPLQLLAWRLAFIDPIIGVQREFFSRRQLDCGTT